jgi:hypothetical protein
MSAQLKPEQWPVDAPYPIIRPHKVYSAIVQVMKAIGTVGIGKNRRNKQQNYTFRGIDDVFNVLNGMLTEANLLILPRVLKRESTERPTKSGGVQFCVALEVEYDFVCADDGSTHTVKTFGEAMDSTFRITNKAMSAAYKYACIEVFCIPTEGTPDADADSPDIAAAVVPEDCFIALADAARQGAKALRDIWENQISEQTRNLITTLHADRLEVIRALVPKRPVSA